MFIKSTLFKWIALIGSVSVLGITAANGGYALMVLPRAPEFTWFGLTFDCHASIMFTDKTSNEDGYRIYMRPEGAANFTLIKTIGALTSSPNAPWVEYVNGLPPQLTNGRYEYKVTAYNSYGEASDSRTVDVTTCTDAPSLPPGDPMAVLVNPLIDTITIGVEDCTTNIHYVDYNTPAQLEEDGFHIWRQFNNGSFTKVADQPVGDSNSYGDSKLNAGTYTYKVSAYKGGMEAYSNTISATLSEEFCAPPSNAVPIPPALENTPQPAAPTMELSCEWEAARNVFLRRGPDVAVFDRLVDVQSGKILPIIGQSEDGTFWVVEVSPGVTGYISKSEKNGLTHGGCTEVSTLTDPEPPEIAPAPTRKPGDSSDTSVAQCSDGIDNDGDGLFDYNPFGSGDTGCTSAEDTSE